MNIEKISCRVSNLPEIKSYFIEGSLELLSVPEFCELLGIMFPLQKEPEAIADYFRLLHHKMLQQRLERTQQVAAQKGFVVRRFSLWNLAIIQIRQILQFGSILSLLGNLPLNLLRAQKPFVAPQKHLLTLLFFVLYPYRYSRRLIRICQPQSRRTYSSLIRGSKEKIARLSPNLSLPISYSTCHCPT